MKKILRLVSLLVLLSGCSSSDNSGTNETNDTLVSTHVFKVDGLEEITAINADCAAGGDGILSEEVDTSPVITINFSTKRSCQLTIDGEEGICSWEAIDGNTIVMDTTNDQSLEMDYEIDSGINVLTLTLTEDWMDANCNAGD